MFGADLSVLKNCDSRVRIYLCRYRLQQLFDDQNAEVSISFAIVNFIQDYVGKFSKILVLYEFL